MMDVSIIGGVSLPSQPSLLEHVNKIKQEFNSPSRLPPVGCKLVIKVGDSEMIAERTGYIASRDDAMEYRLDSTGEVILGRFYWSYP